MGKRKDNEEKMAIVAYPNPKTQTESNTCLDAYLLNSPFPIQLAVNSAAGAFMGSIFGYGSGLIEKKGFIGSFAQAEYFAKPFAIAAGVDSLVKYILKGLRGKDDFMNAAVAGCCAGLTVRYPGAPEALLLSCLTFGGYNLFMEEYHRPKPVLAHSLSMSKSSFTHDVLPPFTLPLPNDLRDGFFSFCQSLKLSEKGPHPSAG